MLDFSFGANDFRRCQKEEEELVNFFFFFPVHDFRQTISLPFWVERFDIFFLNTYLYFKKYVIQLFLFIIQITHYAFLCFLKLVIQ